MNNMNNTTTRHHNITFTGEVEVVGINTTPKGDRLAYTVHFWGIEPQSKQCQYATGWTDSIDLANSWAEQVRSGFYPHGTELRIIHLCR
jgi:hypothetical protein